MGGSEAPKPDPRQEALKSVEAKIDKKSDAEGIQLDAKGEKTVKFLQEVWNPEIEAKPDSEILAKEKEIRREALDKAIIEVVKLWNDSHDKPEEQITREQVYAWIFESQLKEETTKLPDKDFDSDKPAHVKALQSTLLMLGLLKPGYKQDKYDKKTIDAVIAFKKLQKITPEDPKPTDATIQALKKFINPSYTPPQATDEESGDPAEKPKEATANFISTGLQKTIQDLNCDGGLKGKKDSDEKGPVHQLQKILYTISKLCPSIKCHPGEKWGILKDGIDGKYGSDTTSAVKALQTEIQKVIKEEGTKSPAPDWYTPEFKSQTKIEDEGFTDGDFGTRTKQALLKFLELKKPETDTKAKEAESAEKEEEKKEEKKKPEESGKPIVPDASKEATEVNLTQTEKNLKSLQDRMEEIKNTDKRKESNERGRLAEQPGIKFIIDHPEILTWVAASKYGNMGDSCAKEVFLNYESTGGNTAKFSLTITYRNGKKITLPYTHNIKDSRIITNHNATSVLIGIKRALVQEHSLVDSGKMIAMQEALPKLNQLDNSLHQKVALSSNLPDTLETASETTQDTLASTLQEYAQKALGLKIRPVTPSPSLENIASYLLTVNASTQALDTQISALGKTNPDVTKGLANGLPLLKPDKDAIIIGFLKDNEILLKNIETRQVGLKESLKELNKNKENLPEHTRVDPEGLLITLPKTHKVTDENSDTVMYKKSLEFDNYTDTVVTNVEIKKGGNDKIKIITSEIKTADLDKETASVITTTYTLEESETEADEAMAIKNAPRIGASGNQDSEYAVNNHYRFNVADPSQDKVPGQEAPPVFNTHDDNDEVINIEELDPKTKAQTGSYLTVAMSVDSKNMEFENGEWIDTNIRSLYLSKENLQILANNNIDLDSKRPIFKYTEEHDASKVGYFIFDNRTGKIVTISAQGQVEIFDRSHKGPDEESPHEMGKVLYLIGNDTEELENVSDGLSKPLLEKIESADLNKIGEIKLRTKAEDPLTEQGVAKILAEEAQKALGFTMAQPKEYGKDSALVEFSKKLIDRAKGHTQIRFSDTYKKTIIAAFLKDNEKTAESITENQETLAGQLNIFEKDQKENNDGAQVKIDPENLTISPDENSVIKDMAGNETIINLADNRANPITGFSYFYMKDGSFNIIVVRADKTRDVYFVGKKPTGQNGDTLYEKESKSGITKDNFANFFKNIYGVDLTLAPDNLDEGLHTMTLSFVNIATKLEMTVTSDKKISIEGIQITNLKDILKVQAIQAILRAANPTAQEATNNASEDKNRLPIKLEKMVNPAVEKLSNTLTIPFLTNGSIDKDTLITNTVAGIKIALDLKKETEISTSTDKNPNLSAYLTEITKNKTTSSIALTSPSKEKLVRAFLKDHGSRILKIEKVSERRDA